MITTGVLRGYGSAFRCWLRERRRRDVHLHIRRDPRRIIPIWPRWPALERAGLLQDRLVREPATT